MSIRICVTVVSNDQEILERNLMASDMLARQDVDLRVLRDAKSAGQTYNLGLDQADADIFVFAHQDVYFPPDWENYLCQAIDNVAVIDPDWAVIAPTGISENGDHVGAVWSSSQGAIVGRPVEQPTAAQSFDELTIILRRGSGIRFDEDLDGFHMYGTDIVQSAKAAGKGAYLCEMPLVHNDKFHRKLGADFGHCYGQVRRKWASKLPLKTTVLEVTKSGVAWQLYRVRASNSVTARAEKAVDHMADPRIYSRQCGWETATKNTAVGM